MSGLQSILTSLALFLASTTAWPQSPKAQPKKADTISLTPVLDSIYDEFTGLSTVRTKMIRLEGVGGFTYMTIEKYWSVNQDGGYRLIVTYSDNNWAFIEAGETFLLLLDGTERMSLNSPDGSRTARIAGTGGVTEVASFDVPPALLCRLAAADSIRVRVVGARKLLEGSPAPEFTEAVADLSKRYATCP